MFPVRFYETAPTPIFRAKQTIWHVLRQNGFGQKLRSLLPKTAPKSFFRKTHFRSVSTKLPPHQFSGPNRLCGVFWGKIVTDENLPRFSLKRPRNRFSKKHISSLLQRNRPPHLFFGPNELRGAFRGKIVTNKKFARFCLKRPRNRFSKKHVSGPFLQNCLPHLFSRPNGLCGALWRKIVMDKNFAHFCLKRPRNRFFEKHVNGLFLQNRPLTYFRGQTNFVAHFKAKLSWTKTSLAFA